MNLTFVLCSEYIKCMPSTIAVQPLCGEQSLFTVQSGKRLPQLGNYNLLDMKHTTKRKTDTLLFCPPMESQTMNKPAYQQIASTFQALLNCEKSGNQEWMEQHVTTIENITAVHFPDGSGFDSGTHFDFLASKPERLVFSTSYHHMDEWGGYDGWTEHQVIVTPSLQFGFTLRVTGRDRNQIKEYIADEFYGVLSTNMEV